MCQALGVEGGAEQSRQGLPSWSCSPGRGGSQPQTDKCVPNYNVPRRALEDPRAEGRGWRSIVGWEEEWSVRAPPTEWPDLVSVRACVCACVPTHAYGHKDEGDGAEDSAGHCEAFGVFSKSSEVTRRLGA